VKAEDLKSLQAPLTCILQPKPHPESRTPTHFTPISMSPVTTSIEMTGSPRPSVV
jgi:hypothetical protein